MALDDDLDRIIALRDRDDMQPTIDALLPFESSHPENARVLYEIGGAYDTAGREHVARTYYERALEAGLDDDLLRRCFVQYGSTLRNLGEIDASLAVFARARECFPASASLAVFEAITLHAAGRPDASIAVLLEAVADLADGSDAERYVAALRGNAAYIRSLDDGGASAS